MSGRNSTYRLVQISGTGSAASLALIPIAREIFWGPMAYAIMGGIIVGTVLTLLFLPGLYVAWFRIEEPEPGMNDDYQILIESAPGTELPVDAPHRREMENA